MLGGTDSVDDDVRWCLGNVFSGEGFKDFETGLKVTIILI